MLFLDLEKQVLPSLFIVSCSYYILHYWNHLWNLSWGRISGLGVFIRILGRELFSMTSWQSVSNVALNYSYVLTSILSIPSKFKVEISFHCFSLTTLFVGLQLLYCSCYGSQQRRENSLSKNGLKINFIHSLMEW